MQIDQQQYMLDELCTKPIFNNVTVHIVVV